MYYSGYQQQESSMRLTFEANNISEVRELHQMLTRLLTPEATPPKHILRGDDIDELPLSNRTLNALRGENILQVSQLIRLKKHELLRIPNLGKVCAQEIIDVLNDYFPKC
jgi:DNA-directed RNA polymerase alpha subunit